MSRPVSLDRAQAIVDAADGEDVAHFCRAHLAEIVAYEKEQGSQLTEVWKCYKDAQAKLSASEARVTELEAEVRSLTRAIGRQWRS